MNAPETLDAPAATDFGLSRHALTALRRTFDHTADIDRVWIFGSRARGDARPNSDVDLAVDAPALNSAAFDKLERRLQALPLLYKLDVVHLQAVREPVFRGEIARDRRVFWEPRRHACDVEAIGTIQLKRFQSDVLAALGRYLDELIRRRERSAQLAAMEGMEEEARDAADFPKRAWTALSKAGALPAEFAGRLHSSRFDGAGRAIPNVCLKVPTGGGKTLLATASVARVLAAYLKRHTGLVLWVVPNDAIYRQTLKALSDRDHPYRQILNVAGAGRVKVLENDWQACLAAAVDRLDALQREADALHAETARYIRPILLVQVERTGADLRDAGFIHAEDAKAQLLQLGLSGRQVAIKTSDKDDLKAPENIDLVSRTCEVRAIVTKQALQEGWDCPFAYVLCALSAGRNPAAVTQLVGRVLRQPDVTKTGRESLDSCYVLCHDAKTADVVRSIKESLEGEGMGDLVVAVRTTGGDAAERRRSMLERRPQFRDLHIFVPRVCWVEDGGTARRELVYDSDVLAFVPWNELDPDRLAADWAPDSRAPAGESFAIDLSILTAPNGGEARMPAAAGTLQLDRPRIVRMLLDLVPNAWIVWDWVDRVVVRLHRAGYAESLLASSAASLAERLRVDIERERDRIAQRVFERLLADGRIEFRLRADKADYELPAAWPFEPAGELVLLGRPDGRPIEKSLLEPALKTGMNALEAEFAGYLDERTALRWWHRNVAKSQLGLQGWKRHKLYPDFVFAVCLGEGQVRTVLLETKGMYLAGSEDTAYKQALLERLTDAFRDERLAKVGELELAGGTRADVVSDLIFDEAWRGSLERRYFTPP